MQALTKICLRCLHDYCSKQWKLSQPVVVSLTAFLLNWCPPPANTTTHTDTLIPVAPLLLTMTCWLQPGTEGHSSNDARRSG
jgi:hypothetical protein